MMARLGYIAYGLNVPTVEEAAGVEAEPGCCCRVDARTRGGFTGLGDMEDDIWKDGVGIGLGLLLD